MRVHCIRIDHHQHIQAEVIVDRWVVTFVSNTGDSPKVIYFDDPLRLVFNQKPEYEVGSRYELKLSKLA
jgi:hypothetical protein